MRRPIVAGNWKMNGSRSMAMDLVAGILSGLDKESDTEVVICPPFVLIPTVSEQLAASALKWGGQDLDANSPGARTGAVAAEMLTDLDCHYCIVGHSERRSLYGESDDLVAAKFARAQQCGLTPILCIGETLDERDSGQTEVVLERQLDAVVGLCGIESFANSVLAYEPVWAIGTGKTASPDQAQQIHAFVRNKLSVFDAGVARNLRIQYGGSVKAENAAELFDQPDVDGGLIGGASLNANEFVAICRATDE
jgi:triosephosphate isomerase